ncbi:hypothetical protein VNO77_24880 [Canavalia gladiata]|uniref:EF-hand domain-containing protein n=1 Tax=Canavalia gladiata TaxID=3824 RepID=A0AAN9L9M2_CANGL
MGLSEDQISSMKEAFTLFDTDRDGRIAPSELGILMRSLGGNPTQAQLKAIQAEEKLSESFDFTRFLDLMEKHLKVESFDRHLRDAFKVLDKESTGFVSVSELRHILTNIGEKLETSEFDEWIKEADVVSDGKIRYEDFIARMTGEMMSVWLAQSEKLFQFYYYCNGTNTYQEAYICNANDCKENEKEDMDAFGNGMAGDVENPLKKQSFCYSRRVIVTAEEP